MALVHKAEALIRELTGNEAVFKRTKETGIVGGHNPIERGVTAGRPGEACMNTVKKTLARVFGKNELRDEVYASIQARGGHPNIVNVIAWDPSASAIVTTDMGRHTVLEWVVRCRPKAKQIYHVAYQMLDMILWSHSRGVFHRDLAADNFIMKGDEFSDIVSQGDKPVVGLLDFGAGVVSPAVYDSADPDSFVATYEDQWHRGATHGRRNLKDPFATTCIILGKIGIGNATINYHLFDLFSWGKITRSLLDERGLKGSIAIRNLIYGVTTTDPTRRFHPSVDLRQHEFIVRQKAKADDMRVGGYLDNEDIPRLFSLDEVDNMAEVAGASDAFRGYAKLLPLPQPAMAAQGDGEGDAASDPRSEMVEEVVVPEPNGDRPHERTSDQGNGIRQASEPTPPLPPVIEKPRSGDDRYDDRAARDGLTAPPQLQPFIPGRSNERQGMGAVSTLRAQENLAAEMGTHAEGGGEPAREAAPGTTEDSRVAAMEAPNARSEEQVARANNIVCSSARSVPGCDGGVHGRPVEGQVQTGTRAATAGGVASAGVSSSLRTQGQDRRRSAITGANATVPGASTHRTSVLGTLFSRMAAMRKTIISRGPAPEREAAPPRQVQFAEPDNTPASAVERQDAKVGTSKGNKRSRAGTGACEEISGPKESPELSTIAGRLVKRRRASTRTNRGATDTANGPRGPTMMKQEEPPRYAARMATGRPLGAAGVGSAGRRVRRGRSGGSGAGSGRNGKCLRAGTAAVRAGGQARERIGAMDVEMVERGVLMEIAMRDVRTFNPPNNGGQELTDAPTAKYPRC